MFHAWAPKGLSSEKKAVERRELRLHRLQLLDYRRTSAEETRARRKRMAAKFLAQNARITAFNNDVRNGDADIAKHNKRVEDTKRDEGAFEKKRLERERARLDKEEAHRREMEEMEAERERKRKEREERRKAEEAEAGTPATE